MTEQEQAEYDRILSKKLLLSSLAYSEESLTPKQLKALLVSKGLSHLLLTEEEKAFYNKWYEYKLSQQGLTLNK